MLSVLRGKFIAIQAYLKKQEESQINNLTLFNLYAEYIMRNAGLEEAQAGIKIAGRNIKNLRRKRGWQRMRRLDGMSLSELDGREFERTPEVGDG